jgi:hypothetical protein
MLTVVIVSKARLILDTQCELDRPMDGGAVYARQNELNLNVAQEAGGQT